MELGFGPGAVMEHRWGERHVIERMVSLRAGGWRVLARLRNMSSSGAYLQCAVPSANVARIHVDFRDGADSVRLAAHIVRRTSDGIGVEWGEFAPRSVMRMLLRAEQHPTEVLAPPGPDPRVAGMPGSA
ncbi:MAG TPA: PilZ domain-containing protein [Steroidobacteraceae bacterium]|nr:PilZ domain-containing protein [Steroidobacteraceae bacterium]